jgi:predicted GIY-YIG superfamily endonuclease
VEQLVARWAHNPKVGGSNPLPATKGKKGLAGADPFYIEDMSGYQVYIIRCREGRYYIGSTMDVERRIAQHNSKTYRCWTNRYNDWMLVYRESFQTRREAVIREKEIKRMKGGIQFKTLLGS